jgi:hypothetical protein
VRYAAGVYNFRVVGAERSQSMTRRRRAPCARVTLTPLFKMVFDNRQPLFAGSDERVGALLLWHFVEEIEHRSSALRIHHHVTPDRWYRIRKARKVFEHVAGIYTSILAGFEAHVPLPDRHIATSVVGPKGLWLGELSQRLPVVRGRGGRASMLRHVPGRDLRTMLWHLARSQTPRHDPAREPLPVWAHEWHAAYDAGADVTTYEGARL